MGELKEEPGAVFDLLAQLVDKSLVVMQEQHGQARYALLETLRQYSAAQISSSGELPAMRDAHLV